MVQSLDRSQGRAGGIAADATAAPATFTGNRAAADRGAADLRDGPARPLRRRPAGAAEGQGPPERPAPRRRDRPAGPLRAAGGAALHAAQPEELRHRHGRLSAGLVHHEAQPAHQREGGAPARHRRPPSAAAGLDRAGRARADRPPGALAEDADRHAGRGDVARRRRAWRDVRHDGDRAPPSRRAASAPSARSCWRPNRRTAPIRRRRRRSASPCKPIPANDRGRVDLAGAQGGARARRRGDHADQPQHLRPVRDARSSRSPGPSHEAGAFFYCDGANFNAIVGRVRPGDLGVDCMHINLHKTFSTPHGGGGPGAGPVVLSAALAPYAPYPWIVKDGDGWRIAEEGATVEGTAAGPAESLPRPDGHVHPRAGLHHEPRRRRPEAGRRGRRAVGQLRHGRASRTS